MWILKYWIFWIIVIIVLFQKCSLSKHVSFLHFTDHSPWECIVVLFPLYGLFWSFGIQYKREKSSCNMFLDKHNIQWWDAWRVISQMFLFVIASISVSGITRALYNDWNKVYSRSSFNQMWILKYWIFWIIVIIVLFQICSLSKHVSFLHLTDHSPWECIKTLQNITNNAVIFKYPHLIETTTWIYLVPIWLYSLFDSSQNVSHIYKQLLSSKIISTCSFISSIWIPVKFTNNAVIFKMVRNVRN
jgi:hypothetical protein